MDELETTQQPGAAMNMKRIPKLILPLVFVVFIGSCSKPTANSPETVPKNPVGQNLPAGEGNQASCLQAARKLLGSNAEVIKCGHLSDAAHLQAVVAIRVPSLKDDRNGIPISKLAILRQGNSGWDSEINVDKEITNAAGYVGFNFIDDSHPFPYYRVNFSDRGAKWGARDQSQFTLVLLPMTRDGKVDVGDVGIGIGWNPAVERFQEIEPNGEKFAPEVKNPKHIPVPK
jgi:hypothetical protein